jgi:hypothetical protein
VLSLQQGKSSGARFIPGAFGGGDKEPVAWAPLILGIEMTRGPLQNQKRCRHDLALLTERGLPGEGEEPLVETIDLVQSDARTYKRLGEV